MKITRRGPKFSKIPPSFFTRRGRYIGAAMAGVTSAEGRACSGEQAAAAVCVPVFLEWRRADSLVGEGQRRINGAWARCFMR